MGDELADAVGRCGAGAAESADLRLCERADRRILCAGPIVVRGDVEGGVLLPGSEKAPPAAPEAAAAISTAAAFLAKCLE